MRNTRVCSVYSSFNTSKLNRKSLVNPEVSRKSELQTAIDVADSYRKHQEDLSKLQKKSNNNFIGIGSEIKEMSLTPKADVVLKKKQHISFKTDEEIKQSIERANELNKKFANKLNEKSSTEEILSCVLDNLF